MKVPTIEKYMIPTTTTIGVGASLRQAVQRMARSRQPYLPIQNEGKVVGVLSGRKLGYALKSSWAEDFRVEDLMIPSPSVVEPRTSLYAVLDEMPSHRGGYTVVQDKMGRVKGVMTALEAMQAFHDLAHGMAYAS